MLLTEVILATHRMQVSGRPFVYALEQVTRAFACLREALPNVELVGSEFLDASLPGGTIREGIRHENAEHLSFADGSVDVYVSGDVMEHIADPERALAEAARVLRVGGQLFMTAPIDLGRDANVTRAKRVDGSIVALLPNVFHGNPLSPEGSLVFTDFGWELVAQMHRAGLRDAAYVIVRSCEYGHYGVQGYFHATRSDA